jgi:hypothetical protein
MKVVSRPLVILALALLAACSGNSTSGPAGATLQGTLAGSAVQGLTVSVPGSSAQTQADASGSFTLLGVPAGASALRIQGGSIDTTLAVAAVVSGEHRTMTISVSGGRASEEHERCDSDFRGAITAITAPALTVAGRTITTTSATTYSKGGAAIAFADLKVGDPVEIDGTLQADGSVVATSVDVVVPRPACVPAADGGTHGDAGSAGDGGHGDDDGRGDDDNGSLSDDDMEGHHHGRPPCDDDHDVAFMGTLKSISGQQLMVGSVTVNVQTTTVIRKAAATIAVTDLKVGDLLRVEGDLQADLSVNARAIRVLVPGTPDIDVRVIGSLTAVDATAKTLSIDSITIATDATTTFGGEGVHALADLAVGDRVAVVAAPRADGSLLAVSVVRLSFPVPLVEAHGAVTAVAADSITVGTQQFAVGSLTIITRGFTVIALGDIKVGDQVEVHGLQRAAASPPLATRIEALPPPPSK